MKVVDLKPTKHDVRIGQVCPAVEPNVFEDCILQEDGQRIGFFLRKVPKRLGELIDLANIEFRSKRVPKSLLSRSDVIQNRRKGLTGKEAEKFGTVQMSTIIGSVAPKPHMRRSYPTMSSVHSVASAKNFVKAMLLAAKESEQMIRDIMPEQYEKQREILSRTPAEWRFADLFTSSISNYNIAANFHRDAANLPGTVNVIITKRHDSYPGNICVPDYDACFDQCDGSVLVYPAWRNIHGVTPIETKSASGYRNSLVFYPLKAFEGMN